MLTTSLDKENKIVTLEPDGALSKEDFEKAVQIIDPYIKQHEKLNGVIIYTQSFPGWDSFEALIRHLKFIKNHHKKITHLAFVSDSIVGEFAEKIGYHFVDAEIKTFPFDQMDNAKQWILEN